MVILSNEHASLLSVDCGKHATVKGYQVYTFASSYERKFKEIPVALVVLLSYHFIDSCGVCL